jgi:hypothetical protein
MCVPFIRPLLIRSAPGLHGPGYADQSKAGPRKLQKNKPDPLIRNRDNS